MRSEVPNSQPTSFSKSNRRWVTFGIIVALFASIAVGAFGVGLYVANRANPTSNELKVFWEAWQIAQRDFYYTKPDDTTRVQGAITGMLSTYKDQYTFYLPPVQADQEIKVLKGETGGVGAIVGQNAEKELVVTDVWLGGAGDQAGLKTGDILLAADDKTLVGLSVQDAVTLIRGELGTSVKLTVRRTGQATPLILTITRQQINVYSTFVDGDIAYLSMSIFSSNSPDILRSKLEQLLERKPRALIFDLRGNPGGYLEEGISVADLFLPSGKVAIEKMADGSKREFTSKDGDIGESIPMVVLVNKGSASAAEIVSGALKDRKRAILIGQSTYGKGSVQTLYSLSDGSQLRVTHGAWYTPNETPIQQDGKPIGLTPDIIVPIPDDPNAIKPGSDPIREAAIEYINKTYPVTMSLPIQLPS